MYESSCVCEECWRSYRPTKYMSKRFCSLDCRKLNSSKTIAKEEKREKIVDVGTVEVLRAMSMATGTIGAIGELLVCADLLKRQCLVFRAVSPSCPCDLVFIKEGRFIRVEVKMVNQKTNPMTTLKQAKKNNCFDVLAIVTKSGEVSYYTEAGEIFNF